MEQGFFWSEQGFFGKEHGIFANWGIREFSRQNAKTTNPTPDQYFDHTGRGWIHEIMYDGYRMMAARADGRTRLITRNGHDWAARYPPIVAAVDAARSCIIDGEIAKCDERGLEVFDLLRTGPRAKTDVALFAFDLLELNGEDLRREPIEARKADLRSY